MAKATRRERIWENFSRALASKIATKWREGEEIALNERLKTLDDLIYNKYYLPWKKQVAKLPTGMFRKGRSLTILDGESGDDTRTSEFILPEDGPQFHRLPIPKKLFDERYELRKDMRKLSDMAQKLFLDLEANLVCAESFEEVVTKWPQAREMAEEVAMTHATTMNTPLERIIGRYSMTALPAPTSEGK